MKKKLVSLITIFLATGILLTANAKSKITASNPLPSWNEGISKQAIIDFVSKTTREGGADFIPLTQRIACFDNDGTLWAEQPLYFQFLFAIDRIKSMAPQHPEWKTKEPYASIIAGDLKKALAGGEKGIVEMMATTHGGQTTEEFEKAVNDWIDTARHPRFKRPYSECVYQPMLELLAYLRANGFKTFIVSGGGIEFMRAWAERVYGIPPEQVIGSSGKYSYQVRNGVPVLIKEPAVNFVDDKEGKPVGIQMNIGRRPVAAVGNSDGDFQMLEWTTSGTGARFGMLVHHDDETREWAYDRNSPIGALNKGLDEASNKGWILVSMKHDWKKIFPKD
jgi:hypothetical protein